MPAPSSWSRTIAICWTPVPTGCGSWPIGRVTSFDGNLDDYQRLVLSRPRRAQRGPRVPQGRHAPQQSRSDLRRAAADRRVQTATLRQRMAQAEAEVARLNREIAALDAALADGALFARDPAKAAALSKSRALAATRWRRPRTNGSPSASNCSATGRDAWRRQRQFAPLRSFLRLVARFGGFCVSRLDRFRRRRRLRGAVERDNRPPVKW